MDAGGEAATLSEELETRYQQTIAQLRRRLKEEKQAITQLRTARANPWAETSELEQHFLDAIEEARRAAPGGMRLGNEFVGRSTGHGSFLYTKTATWKERVKFLWRKTNLI